MNTDASIVDCFLTAAEAKAEEKKQARRDALRETYGSAAGDYERELQPVVTALAALPARSGGTLCVHESTDEIGFTISLQGETRRGPMRRSFEYSFHAEQDAPATHKISLGYKSDIRSGHHRPDTQPETFADVRLLLADWIAENLPQRLSELRDIAAKMNDADMELSRSIRTGGTIKLKPAGNA